MIEREKVESALRDAIEAASEGNIGRAIEFAMGVGDAFIWTQEGLQKRIDQLTAENEELRERVEEAEARVIKDHQGRATDCIEVHSGRYGPGECERRGCTTDTFPHLALNPNACPICRRVLGGGE